MTTVLMIGSAPMAMEAAGWPRKGFDRILAINNAHRVRPDWDFAIYPWDFATERRPVAKNGQRVITETEFVPAQNGFGGFVYAGATMAFTSAYWALNALRPRIIAAFGCDMHYGPGRTHFYGRGEPDPLRRDITLRNLEAKSARLMVMAALQGCAMVNLSTGPSRLIFPRAQRCHLAAVRPLPFCPDLAAKARKREADLGYDTPSGRYWEELERFDVAELDALDQLWLDAARMQWRASA